jgi:hypothetical protein
MIKESVGKGARNAIGKIKLFYQMELCLVGTYRIVLYQHQAPDLDKERVKVNGHLIDLAEEHKRMLHQKRNSKACVIS